MSWLPDNAEAAYQHFEKHPEEELFMKYFSDVFQVTYANRWGDLASKYSYYILKPYSKPAHRYGLGETLALYAPYPEVQAGSLKTIARLQEKYKERVQPVWNLIITDDPLTVEHLDALTAGKDLEYYSIPFSRQELEARPNAEFIYSRLDKYIHGRDLFAFQSALQSNTFFFGRDWLVGELVGQIENGQNFGLFGLRKSGKTSVLLAVERHLDKLGNYKTIHLDCQSPAIYLSRWNSLLSKICAEISGEPPLLLGYAEQVTKLQNIVAASQTKLILVFDEVENISFDLSPAPHWNEDFLPFWGAIRAIHQSTRGKLTYGVAGVNPHLFESPLVNGKDNPILLGTSPLYLWPLTESKVREMVRTIGRYMGLSFQEDVYTWLFQQFGGHPFLIRRACSLICRKTNKASGSEVVLSDFISRQNWLDEQLGRDILNILIVLAQHYPNEFEHLLSLARGEHEWIQLVRSEEPQSLTHILEYRIVTEDNGALKFSIEALERFLQTSGEEMKKAVSILVESSAPSRYDDIPAPEQLELWTRINRARNSVEPRLRTLIHRAVLLKYGERQALQKVLDKFSSDKQRTLSGYSLAQIFNGESKALYLKDLKEIITREWDLVKHVFGNDKKLFEIRLDQINSDGRSDAHANPINESVVLQIEATTQELIDQMAPFLE